MQIFLLLGQYNVAGLAEETGFPSRKIHYFLTHVLDEYVRDQLRITASKGKTTRYPVQVLNRLKLIKLALEKIEEHGIKFNYTRTELKAWMNQVSDEEVSDVLNGTETLKFGFQTQENENPITETLDGETLAPDSKKYGRQIPPEKYVSPKEESKANEEWKTMELVTDCELRYRGDFSASRHTQLMLLADLLRSMLSKE